MRVLVWSRYLWTQKRSSRTNSQMRERKFPSVYSWKNPNLNPPQVRHPDPLLSEPATPIISIYSPGLN